MEKHLGINKKITKGISACHIYNDVNYLQYIDTFKDSFLSYRSINLKDDFEIPSKAHIYIIESEKIDKNILKYIQKIKASYSAAHIYIFTGMDTNISVLKFSLNYDIKNVYTLPIKKEEIDKFLQSAIKKVAIAIHEANNAYLGEVTDEVYPILIFRKNKLNYANTNAKKFYSSDNLKLIERNIGKNKELMLLITGKESLNTKIFIENGKKEYEELFCSINKNSSKEVTVLSILKNKNLIDNDIENLIQNRFIFIERLKDKIIQVNISKKDFFILLISIDNGKNIQNIYSKVDYFNFLKDFLLSLNNFKESKEKIVEWNSNLFILTYDNLNFNNMKNFASILHNNIIESQKNSKFAPIITTSFFSILNKDLNEIIDFIYKVANNSLTIEEAVKEKYFEYKFLNDKVNDQEQIEHLLHNCIHNKIPIKLLNIYKGLCVNTDSKVLKYSNGFFYLSCEKLQRYIIKIDNETIIQSPTFPYDIKAIVKFIDISKSYIIIEKLEFLKNSANNRQHTRVQPTVRIPITIKKDNFIKHGEILDLSINSIAVKVKQNVDKTLEGSQVQAIFKLPNRKKEDGYSSVNIDTTILIVKKMDDYTKVVLKIKEEDGTNSDILQYVFNRQKELVMELKKAIKIL